jgi:hypothetical protein
MSSKRKHDPNFPLCRFAFADGRHCALPAQPNHDGLCPSHFNALHRFANSKAPARHLSPLSWKYLDELDIRQVQANLQEAVEAQAICPRKAGTMNYIGNLLISSLREAKAEAFRKGAGPDWDAIRILLDDPDAHLVPDS